MVDPEVVRQMNQLRRLGWGTKRIAKELGVAPGTVRRYKREGVAAETQVRPNARRLNDKARADAVRLFEGAAEGNAVVVQDLLARSDVHASVRTVQRAVQAKRAERKAAALASIRFETAPGRQMQIDFGEKRVRIGGVQSRIYFFVAVLGYSRRIFVKPFLSQRHEDWREGIAAAFRHFDGIPSELLVDNAKALVIEHIAGERVVLHEGLRAFCRDHDLTVKACRPYRARTKGKTESGVKYVKRNAIAGREFSSFASMESWLGEWMHLADRRVHGTTKRVPRECFEESERDALRPLPERPLPVRERRLSRKVANDCLVDVDTVRYSVPHRLVRDRVEVHVGEQQVVIFHRGKEVARHARSQEPHARVVDHAHYDGLLRPADAPPRAVEQAPLGRPLEAYAAIIGEAA